VALCGWEGEGGVAVNKLIVFKKMEKLDYLNKNIDDMTRSIFKAMQNCLSSKDSCLLLRNDLLMDYKKGVYVVRKISCDIEENFAKLHTDLVNGFISILKDEDVEYKKRNRVAMILYDMYDILPINQQKKILRSLLSSKYKSVRNRGYKMIKKEYKPECKEVIKDNWENYDDEAAGEIIYKNFELEYVYSQFEKFKELFEDWQIRQIVAKLSVKYPEVLENLKDENPLDYLYVMAKSKQKVDESFAFKIFQETDWKSKSLVVWALGEMKMWNSLQKIYEEEEYEGW
jgi:hypothetical protein